MGQMVKQIKYPIISHSGLPKGLTEPLLSHHEFLQIRTSRNDKVRASSEFLVLGDLRTPSGNLWVYDAARIPRGDRLPIISSGMNYHNVQKDSLDFLYSKGQTTLTYGKPEIAYELFNSGKMQQIVPESSKKPIEIEDIQFMGPTTDFQVYDKLLYVVNANGFISIIELVRIEGLSMGFRDKFLSVTPLPSSHPISLAVSEKSVFVLSVPKKSLQ